MRASTRNGYHDMFSRTITRVVIAQRFFSFMNADFTYAALYFISMEHLLFWLIALVIISHSFPLDQRRDYELEYRFGLMIVVTRS